jgi:ArsR family transcriptional regulator
MPVERPTPIRPLPMAAPPPLPELATEAPALFRALGHPIRLELLRHVAARGPICVCHLEDALPYSQPLISKHLAVLRRLGLLTSRREGKWVYYSLDVGALSIVGGCLDGLLEAARTPNVADHCDG